MTSLNAAHRLRALRMLTPERLQDPKDTIAEYRSSAFHNHAKGRYIETGLPGLHMFVLQQHPSPLKYRVYLVNKATDYAIGVVEFSQADRKFPWAFTPHSGFLPGHQGLGYGYSIYKWFLDDGNILITGQASTALARKLWAKLGKAYPLHYMNIETFELIPKTEKALSTEHGAMLLLGKGKVLDDVMTHKPKT